MEQTLKQYNSFAAVENRSSGSDWSWSYLGVRSGSYLFHPESGSPAAVGVEGPAQLQLLRGAKGYISELRHVISSTESQVWRLFQGNQDASGFVQLQFGVGPLQGNRELVTAFKTDIATTTASGSQFYTDNNGFSMQRRTFSASRTFPDGTTTRIAPDDSYATALNFAPIVRSAYIADEQRHFTLLVAQSGAAVSRNNGELEVMLHRRNLQDDAKGACSVFNDTTGQYANIPNDTSWGTTCSRYDSMGTCRADGCPAFSIPMNISNRIEPEMWLLAGALPSQQQMHRQSQALNNAPAILFSASPRPVPAYAPLGSLALPSQVHVLTLRPALLAPGRSTTADKLVLRLQHLDAKGKPEAVSFRASGLCRAFGKSNIEERSLTLLHAVAPGGSGQRWNWTAGADIRVPRMEQCLCEDMNLSIAPGDVRTFKIHLQSEEEELAVQV
jgi:hypothetical protein